MLTEANAKLPENLGIFADSFFEFLVKWEIDGTEYEKYFYRYDKMMEYIEDLFQNYKVPKVKVLLMFMTQLYSGPSA